MNKKRPFLKKMNWNTKEDGTKISSSIEDLKWFLSQTSVGRCQCDQIGQFVTLWETKIFLQKLLTLGPLFKTSLFNYHKQFWLILGQHFETLATFYFNICSHWQVLTKLAFWWKTHSFLFHYYSRWNFTLIRHNNINPNHAMSLLPSAMK